MRDIETTNYNAAFDVGEHLETAIVEAIDAYASLGIKPEQIDEAIKECAFNAWMHTEAFQEDLPCTCSLALIERGGFSGNCPTHGRGGK
jgi:hypothetical protein